jgi:serine/threonine-protein kinase
MSKLAPEATLVPGDRLGGAYEVRGLLGQGAMGVVYEVEREGERLAAKLLAGGAHDEQSIARFSREIRVMMALESPHIVPVVDQGEDTERHCTFLIMPLLRGRDLGTVLAGQPLAPEVAVRLICQAALGLEVVHAAGVIHRDIKPENLFLALDGDRVTVQIADFGIARDARASIENVTQTGTMVGTPVYMAPEQFLNPRRVSVAADVWSLSLALYEALSGLNPLAQTRSYAELVLRLTTLPIQPIQDFAPWIDPALALVLHRGLLHDVTQRTPTIHALREALLPFTGGATEVTTSMLHPLEDALRQPVAPRADYTFTHNIPVREPPPEPVRSRPPPPVAAIPPPGASIPPLAPLRSVAPPGVSIPPARASRSIPPARDSRSVPPPAARRSLPPARDPGAAVVRAPWVSWPSVAAVAIAVILVGMLLAWKIRE